MARGALEDRVAGQSVGVEAKADSPLELSRALAKMLLRAPSMLARGTRAGGPQEGGGKLRDRVASLRRKVGDRLGRELARRLGPDADD